MVVCLPTAASTYKWHAIGSGGVATGLTEGITDIVGGMFTTTPTMTGVSATFQDSTNDIDLAVLYASSGITNTAADTTAAVGSADTAARGDHQHGIGTHTHADATHGGTIAATAISDATATPTASKIPIADGSGKLAAGWGGAASTLATLDGSSKVVEDPANATATPTASKIPIADGSGKLAAGWGGAASTLATLDGSSKVVEDPANATATPGNAKIPISDGSAHLDGWISAATAATPGLVEHQNWGDYVPSWVFGTADPTTNVVKVGRYMQVGNMVTFYCSFEADDGNDGTLTSVTLPVAPTDTNTQIPLRSLQKVNTTWTDPLCYIDATTSLNIQAHTATVCTDAAACAYYISGSYEVSAT